MLSLDAIRRPPPAQTETHATKTPTISRSSAAHTPDYGGPGLPTSIAAGPQILRCCIRTVHPRPGPGMTRHFALALPWSLHTFWGGGPARPGLHSKIAVAPIACGSAVSFIKLPEMPQPYARSLIVPDHIRPVVRLALLGRLSG